MTDEEKIKQLEERLKKLELIVENMLNCGFSQSIGVPMSPVLASFDFSDENCRKNSGWKIFNAENIDCNDALSFKSMNIERTLGVFYDPMLIHNCPDIPCENVKRIHVRLKSNVDASQKCMMRVFFTTNKYPEFSQSKSVYDYYPAGRNVDVYVDTNSRYWNGILTGIRIDPVEGLRGSIEIDVIELLDANNNVVFGTDFTKVKSVEETGWILKNINDINLCGRLMFSVDMLEKKKVYIDPFIRNDNMDVDAGDAKYIHIKMRTELDDKTQNDVYMQILFKTKTSDFWTQDKSMRYNYEVNKDIDAYVEVKQLFWKGTLTALRIDPFEKYSGKSEIRLVELVKEIPKSVAVDMLDARMRNLEDRFNKTYN